MFHYFLSRLAMSLAAFSVSVIAASAQGDGGYAPITIPLRIEQAPGNQIYYSVGNPGIPGPRNEGNTSNAAFVITDEGVVVFDALGTPSHGWALLNEIRRRTDKPVRYVVLSHYHADHIYGLQAFREHTQAIIIAQEKALEYNVNSETADEKASERLEQRQQSLAPWVDRNTRVIPPDLVFNDRLRFTLGGRRFTLQASGPAHAGSDLLMTVEPDRVLFAGDIVQNSRIPFLNGDDVDTLTWLRALESSRRWIPRSSFPAMERRPTRRRRPSPSRAITSCTFAR